VIDIHCHILAGIDDGPKSWDVSEEMCRMAAADGIEHMVATPHANERYPYHREQFKQLLDDLHRRLADSNAGKAPAFSLGCDFHLSYENLQDVMAVPERYTIEGSSYLLVELNNYSIPVQIESSFSRLVDMGLAPIITHPERNPILQTTPNRILQWIELGCAVQVTGSALTGAWGERARHTAEWLLKRNAVHVLATDSHDTKRRPPILSQAREAAAGICGQDIAFALVDENPRAIITGQLLPFFPAPSMKA
jgi:protein-tyrosine phosphatase